MPLPASFGRIVRVLALPLACALPGWSAADAPPQDRRIAITIDDLPMASATPATMAEMQRVHEALRAALARHGARAVGFVNEDRLYRPGEFDPGVALLDRWLAAGMELGNHGFGHPSLWKLPLERYQDAVVQGEPISRWLSAQRGVPYRYYRHPYTQTGKTEAEKAQFEAFLAARGYEVAPMTVDHDDYLFACIHDKGTAEDRARLAPAYQQHLEHALDSYESMSVQLFERPIAQILLIHANRLNADTLDQTLDTLERRGYRFITLEEALRDPAYRTPDAASGRFGPSWLTRWAKSLKRKLTRYGHDDPTGWVAERHRALCGG